MSNLQNSFGSTEVGLRKCKLEFRLDSGLSLSNTRHDPLGHTINGVISRYPASDAGLETWDTIIMVNDIDVNAMSSDKVMGLIERERKTDVVITRTTNKWMNGVGVTSTDVERRICQIEYPEPDLDALGFSLHSQYKGIKGHHCGIKRESVASYAGLKHNDRLLEVNGVDVKSRSREDVLRRIISGEQAVLTVTDIIENQEKSSIDEDLIGAVGGQQRKNKNRSSAQQKPSPANRKPINLMTLPLTLQTHDPSTDEEAKEEKPEEKLSFAAVCKKPAKVLPKKKICPFEMTEDLKKRVPSSYTQLLLNPPSVSGHIKDIKLQSKKYTALQFEGLKLVSGPSGFANYGYLNFFDKYEDEYWLEINAKEQDDDPDRKRDFMLKRIRELRIKKIYPSIEKEFNHLYDEWVRACKMQPRVGSFLLNEDCTQCLVIQEKNGNWGVPKGRLMFDEAPFSGIVREVHEESGIDLLSEGAFMDKVIQHGKYTLSVVRGIEVKPARTYSAFYEPEIIG